MVELRLKGERSYTTALATAMAVRPGLTRQMLAQEGVANLSAITRVETECEQIDIVIHGIATSAKEKKKPMTIGIEAKIAAALRGDQVRDYQQKVDHLVVLVPSELTAAADDHFGRQHLSVKVMGWNAVAAALRVPALSSSIDSFLANPGHRGWILVQLAKAKREFEASTKTPDGLSVDLVVTATGRPTLDVSYGVAFGQVEYSKGDLFRGIAGVLYDQEGRWVRRIAQRWEKAEQAMTPLALSTHATRMTPLDEGNAFYSARERLPSKWLGGYRENLYGRRTTAAPVDDVLRTVVAGVRELGRD